MDDDMIRKVRTTTISDLPEEVLTQVLIRLPAKDIVPCVYVQKSWCSLIKTRMFITMHSNYHQNTSSSNPNNKYLLFWNSYKNAYEIRVDDIQCEKYLELKYPAGLSHHLNFQSVSNGLICFFDLRVDKLYLWNPVIQKYITLPNSPQPPPPLRLRRWMAVAFGFVPQINDYLVVYMAKYVTKAEYVMKAESIITCVYSLNSNSWKQISHDDNHIHSVGRSTFVNGIAIWNGYNSHRDRILVCFDTKTEMLREILSPKSHYFSVIHAFDESIIYISEKGRDMRKLVMWVLKGDPMNEFVWQKKMMVRLQKNPYPHVLGLRNNGEPIICNASDLISYNLDSRKSYDLVKSRDGSTPFWKLHNFKIKPFAESLFLLDIDSTKYFAKSLEN